MNNNNEMQGAKRKRENATNEDERQEDTRQRTAAATRAPALDFAQANNEALIQQLVGQLEASGAGQSQGLPALSQFGSAAVPHPALQASRVLAQQPSIPGMMPPLNYAALALIQGVQRQNQVLQMQLAAAQNPLLMQLLTQRILGPGTANQQILGNPLLTAGAGRPDPPAAVGNPGASAPTPSANLATISSSNSVPQGQAVPRALMTVPSAAGLQHGFAAPALQRHLSAPRVTSSVPLSLPTPTANTAPAPAPKRRNTRSKLLYVASDDESVNGYQCFARKQIELFEATQEDVDAGAQGRNKPIILGQVGIRCIHCSDLHPRFRARASVYYPSRLAVMYQAAQNIVNTHLPELCESIPEEVRQKLLHLNSKRSAVGGGKVYWGDTAVVQGVVDTDGHGLRFGDNPLPQSD